MTKSEQLLSYIREHNKAYRAGQSIVSDAEYDREVEELRRIDPDNEWFKHTEPVHVASSRKRKLPISMKSLSKAKSIAELKDWIKTLGLLPTTKLVVMPKYDGISWLHDEVNCVTYSRGGADNEGQDCTAHFAKGKFPEITNFRNIPAMFTYGELVFTRSSWEENMKGKISDSTGEPYRSPRNAVAGFINRDIPSEDLCYTSFVRYGVDEGSLDNWTHYSHILADFKKNIKHANECLEYRTISVSELDESRLHEWFVMWNQICYIDGLVVYIDDLQLWQTIGRQQTTGNPMYAIAYKHPDFTDVFDTTVKGVSWKISKAGALKPVVNIEAVDTGDCTMENPTGYNAKYIFENSIGSGADITVTRSGGVIPKILSVTKEASSETMISQREDLLYCPDCGKPTQWNDSAVELVCTNTKCPGIVLAKVVHFYKTLNAEQMGEETIARMFKAGYNTLSRILDITFDELMMIDGFGESIANIILDTNKRIREGVEITLLMHASDCFQGIGQVKAKSILMGLSEGDRFAFVNGYVQTEKGFDESPQFLALNKTMQSFLKGVNPFYQFVADNRLKIAEMQAPKEIVGDKYAGMKVCFTGIRDKDLETLIVEQGGEIVSGVSKKTTHLIVADANSTSSKTSKAKLLGIPVMTINEFKSM